MLKSHRKTTNKAVTHSAAEGRVAIHRVDVISYV